jgi:hypothetical protein
MRPGPRTAAPPSSTVRSPPVFVPAGRPPTPTPPALPNKVDTGAAGDAMVRRWFGTGEMVLAFSSR